MLLYAEHVSTRSRGVESLTMRDGILIGLAQACALIPGVSRSGATITGGLFLGLDRTAAARYSFLLSIPAVVLSGLLELRHATEGNGPGAGATIIATLVAFVVGYASIAGLLQVPDDALDARLRRLPRRRRRARARARDDGDHFLMLAIVAALGAALAWGISAGCDNRSTRLIGIAAGARLGAADRARAGAAVRRLGGRALAAVRSARCAWIVVGGVGCSVGLTLAYAAIGRGAVSVVAPVMAVDGALAALASVALGEHIAIATAAGLALVIAGMLVVLLRHGLAGARRRRGPLARGRAAGGGRGLRLRALPAGRDPRRRRARRRLAAADLPRACRSPWSAVPLLWRRQLGQRRARPGRS